MVSMEQVTTTAAALNQMLEPLTRSLSTEAARSLAAVELEPSIQARIDELAELCNEGQLSEAERSEYQSYVEGAEILSLLKLKARRYLREHGEA
jgi:predicted transcriptional regulator